MQLSNKQKIIAAVVVLATAFATGRFTAPEKVRVETKVVTQTDTKQDKNTQVNTDKDQHLQVIKTEIKKPDGTTVTRTRTVKDTDTKQQTKQDVKTDTQTVQTVEQSKTVEAGHSRVTISALAGVDVTSPTGLMYGASISRPLLGPVCLGVWGLTNKTAGISLGLQF